MDSENALQVDLDLMVKMRRCGHVLHHKYSLNFSQNKILLILNREGFMSQKALIDEMRIQAGSLSELLTKLESSGLIERKRCTDDKRNCSIYLTETGRQKAEEFSERRKEMARFLFQTLNDEQKSQLGDILAVLLEAWDVQDS